MTVKRMEQHEITKPKVVECPYCKTTLDDEILSSHKIQCLLKLRLGGVKKHHCKSTHKGSGKDPNDKNHLDVKSRNTAYSATENEFPAIDVSSTPNEFSGDLVPASKNVLPMKSESESLCHKPNPKTLVSEINLLSKNFEDLFTNENCWDTVVQVEDKEFKVHRAVLCARSTVFSAMFQHETAEKQTGIVKIPDCDADSFKLFLKYLYTGKLEDVSSNSVIHLYTISDKYNVEELKISCAKYLAQNIAIENISDIVILADEYDEEEMFSAIQEFFNKNFNEIILTKEWEKLLKYKYRLANKLLIGKSKADRDIK